MTEAPTQAPTHAPTEAPTHAPTDAPTHAPTEAPTHAPTEAPTHAPTSAPVESHVQAPSDAHASGSHEAPTSAPVEAHAQGGAEAHAGAQTQVVHLSDLLDTHTVAVSLPHPADPAVPENAAHPQSDVAEHAPSQSLNLSDLLDSHAAGGVLSFSSADSSSEHGTVKLTISTDSGAGSASHEATVHLPSHVSADVASVLKTLLETPHDHNGNG